MRAYTAAEVVDVWERGLQGPSVRRALELLAPLCEESLDALAQLPIGRRDARLLAVRELTFGRRMPGLVNCPSCAAAVELELDVETIRAGGMADEGIPAAPLVVEHHAGTVTFRLPHSEDLAALAAAADEHAARALLLERCVLTASDAEGGALAPGNLSAELASAVAARMSASDPQAEIELALDCPACGHAWSAPFDIASYFWNELAACAERLVHEVHALASAYGWSEAEILALSPARRGAYLQLIAA